jgi:hypothetical protein
MRYVALAHPLLALFAMFPVLTAFSATQIVPFGDEQKCSTSGTVTITVADEFGALIPNAFVLIRGDRLHASKPFQVEMRTDASGKAIVSIPCGYADFYIGADTFIPQAKKLPIEQASSSTSFRLSVYPIRQY